MADEAPQRVHYQHHTSWDELFSELYGGITTSMFRVGTPEDADAPTVFKTYFPPNNEVAPHSHSCDYAEVILEGCQQVTRKWYYPGDIRIAKANSVYGPLLAGPEGVTVLLIFRTGEYAPIPIDGNAAQFDKYQDGLDRLSS